MTTQQIERPLDEVDETAERLQSTMTAGADEPTQDRPVAGERPAWVPSGAWDILQRVAQDPGSQLRAMTLAVGLMSAVVIVIAAVWSRRRPPRTAEDVLLERSREAFDRARETLETIASRLPSIDS
jgi:hypothetical protein